MIEDEAKENVNPIRVAEGISCRMCVTSSGTCDWNSVVNYRKNWQEPSGAKYVEIRSG